MNKTIDAQVPSRASTALPRGLAVVIGLAGTLLAPGPAAAAGPDARVAEARRACAAGDVQRGVALLAEIVAERNDANAVYNQGRCYQSNGRSEQALARFREYLRLAPGLPAADRERVNGHIRELEQELDRRYLGAGRAPPALEGGAAAPASELQAGAEPAPPREGNPTLRALTVAGAVLCVAALGGGAYYSFQTMRLQSQLEDESRQGLVSPESYWRHRQAGRTAQQRQWLGYGAGAAALTGSVVLYLLQGRF